MKSQKTKTKKINLGCGNRYLPDFINCEFDKIFKADVYFDMAETQWPFEDNSVDFILAAHCLEHLSIKGYFNAFKEMYRISKDRAIVEIHYPHHLGRFFFNDPTHQIAITLEGLQLFSKKFNRFTLEIKNSNSTFGLDHNIDFEIKNWLFCPRSQISTLNRNSPNHMDYTPDEFYELAHTIPGIIDNMEVSLVCIKS